MSLNKLHILLLLLSANFVRAQFTFDHLEYKNRIANSAVYLLDNQAIHSGVLPLIRTKEQSGFQKEKGQFLTLTKTKNDEPRYGFRFYPLADLGAGIESGKSANGAFKYAAGIGLGIDFSSTKFYATGKLLPYVVSSAFVADSIQRTLDMDLGTTRPAEGLLFQRSEFLLAYKPNRFFTFLGGYGKNFFGEGYRSLLLSDHASNYPFLKIETTFSSIKYVNLYTIWNDNSVNPSNRSLDQMKFASLHYLSWNITREFNLSVFESVV